MDVNDILPIVTEGDNRLKCVLPAYDFSSEQDPERLERQLINTMYANDGCGLAGNQVGIMQRVFAIGEAGSKEQVFYNPSIIEFGPEKTKFQEGCLSFPGLRLLIIRPNFITVKYQDSKGDEHTERFEGLWARVFQHELDHINGITFIEHVGRTKLDLARRRQKKYLERNA